MGCGNSPSIAGCLGAAFLRRLAERHPEVFGGTPVDNTWRNQVATGEYDSRLSHGRVLISSDLLSAVLLVDFMDDFFLHGPTYDKTKRAVNHFMDYAVEVGLLCNPVKVVPPSQQVRYCGFIFDTTGTPRLRVPSAKRSRAHCMIEYLQSFDQTHVPRLSLVVVAGVLESMVDATPARTGHTFLRRLYDAIWATESPPHFTARDRYYATISLPNDAWQDLQWWQRTLQSDFYRQARPSRTATLIAHCGDGSGTGTGGTDHEIGQPHRDPTSACEPGQMWMGTWAAHVHSFSSNWRELKTLQLTLHRESQREDNRSVNTTVFYFTDNLVTYYVVNNGSARNPRLQALIYQIKALEHRLGCFLEVVHIPGTTIIQQGSDDLSRGLWLSPRRNHIPIHQLLPALFNSVQLNPGWEASLRDLLPFTQSVALHQMDWTSTWSAENVLDRCTVWTPPPEMAQQALFRLLKLWTERPLTTSAIILLPRVLQRRWHRMSRHLHQLRSDDYPRISDLTTEGIKAKTDSFIFNAPNATMHHCLPVVILYLATHERSLPKPRMDVSPYVVPWLERKWYLHQKDVLHGL